jgi:predicted kinase
MKLFFSIIIFLKITTSLFSDTLKEDEKILFSKIFSSHLKTLKNLNKENPPCLILFSAAPGMGKTTLAKFLEKQLSAIRISSDEIRILLKENEIDPKTFDEKNILEKYFGFLHEKLKNISKNKLMIFDANVDRIFPKISNFAKQNNYKTLTIRLTLPPEEAKKRIISREKNPENYLKHFDKWYKDYLNFNIKNADYFLDASSKEEYFSLLKNIKEKLNS